MILSPADEKDADKVEILRGPNIKDFPLASPLPETMAAKALLKVGDNITTDHIMPAGSKILPYRSNIPYLSQFCFAVCDKEFARRCLENGKGVIVGGSNYGQGSSREHAALVPLYLGIRAVLAKSFARIHCANLVNAGILPLVFEDRRGYDGIDQMDELEFANLREAVSSGEEVTVFNRTKNTSFRAQVPLSERQRKIVLDGGLLNYTRERGGKR